MSTVGVSFCCPQLVPVNGFKTLFLLLTLLATYMQWALNEKNVSIYTPSNFGLRTRGSSASEILILGWLLACIGSGMNKITVDFGADINNELSYRKQDISVR